LLVRPERSTVSDYCTQLTTLTQEELEGGMSLAETCRLLQEKYRSGERTWASFGDYDRRQMQKECQARGIPYPFGRTHINVKNLFALVHNLPKEMPLDKAMAHMGFPLEGTHHRGGDDAWNIARLLGHLLLMARGE
jgi:inhibitor of KinA sporulation pathway (predicted exonuclease)